MFRETRATQDRELRCPRDGGAMTKVAAGDVTFDRCTSCSGVWFDAKELRILTGDAALESMATHPREAARPSAFGCPRCWGDCEQTRVGRVSVDTCTSCHGVWLDAGELDAAREEATAMKDAIGALAPWQRIVLLVR